jgi:hypothetical protein
MSNLCRGGRGRLCHFAIDRDRCVRADQCTNSTPRASVFERVRGVVAFGGEPGHVQFHHFLWTCTQAKLAAFAILITDFDPTFYRHSVSFCLADPKGFRFMNSFTSQTSSCYQNAYWLGTKPLGFREKFDRNRSICFQPDYVSSGRLRLVYCVISTDAEGHPFWMGFFYRFIQISQPQKRYRLMKNGMKLFKFSVYA